MIPQENNAKANVWGLKRPAVSWAVQRYQSANKHGNMACFFIFLFLALIFFLSLFLAGEVLATCSRKLERNEYQIVPGTPRTTYNCSQDVKFVFL